MNLFHTPAEGDFPPHVSESTVHLPGVVFILQSEISNMASVQLKREGWSQASRARKRLVFNVYSEANIAELWEYEHLI